MIAKAGPVPPAVSVRGVRRQRRAVGCVASAGVLVVSLVLVGFAGSNSLAGSIALFVVVGAIVAASVNPIYGVHAIVFFTLIGDGAVSAWLPFKNNLSSEESLLYLSDKLPISPLEVLVAMTLVFWRLGDRPGKFVAGPVFNATAIFTGFAFYGFVLGIARGGDPRVALFEGRSIFLLLPVYILIVNLFDGPGLRRLAWTAIFATFVHALLALQYLDNLTPLELEIMEDLGEHPAAVHWNVILLFALVMFVYRAGTAWSRFILVAMCVPVGIVYIAAERRAAIAGLVVGLALVLLGLFWHNRARLLVLGPICFIALAGYTAVFWNSTSAAGFPAQAIKTIVSPEQAGDKDRSSDVYRQIENFNLNFTIRSSPVVGLGFGHEFYRPIELPDLSFYEFYRYIPHNSVLWIWIKTGFFGFVSMLMMFAVAIRAGAATFISRQDATGRAFALMGISYVVMYVTFAFVDIAWDPRSMVFLAVAFALCSQHERETDENVLPSTTSTPTTIGKKRQSSVART